ncbi:phage tail protein [Bacillus badius]|uniref:phage tail-collar fiber domain-containing protein n=1 Tax=Bacillus badius TaxID=1455 RepID=UPI001CBDA89B|nr:phage tail protein [Bacillus badius]UAT29495.1 phage tail protein [Bacillus badius]
MGAFGGLHLTNKGRNLQTKAQTGVAIHFSRMAIGDGSLGGSSVLELNALKSEKMSFPIAKLKVLAQGQAIVGSVLSNKDITAGFYFREIGVFATDPTEGEILYCYGNAGATADYIPAGSGGSTDVIEKTMDVITLVGNAANVTATINQSLIFETPEGAQEKVNLHAADKEKHITSADRESWNAKETTAGAQAKANAAEARAKAYTDTAPEAMLQNMGRFATKRSSKNANGTFLKVERKRKDGTLFMKAEFSSPNADGNPTVRTITTYAADGTTVVGTPIIFDVLYDADGDYVEEVPR